MIRAHRGLEVEVKVMDQANAVGTTSIERSFFLVSEFFDLLNMDLFTKSLQEFVYDNTRQLLQITSNWCSCIVLFSVENKSALSDEGKILNSLLKTTSVRDREKTQSSTCLPRSCWCKFCSLVLFFYVSSQLLCLPLRLFSVFLHSFISFVQL